VALEDHSRIIDVVSRGLELWLTWVAAAAAGAVLAGSFDLLVIVRLARELAARPDPALLPALGSLGFAGALLNANLTAVCQAVALRENLDDRGAWVALTAAGSAAGWLLLVGIAGVVSAPSTWFTSQNLPLLEGTGLGLISLFAGAAQAVVLRRHRVPLGTWVAAVVGASVVTAAVVAGPALIAGAATGGPTSLLLLRIGGCSLGSCLTSGALVRLLARPDPP
jgi:hypothetical protein